MIKIIEALLALGLLGFIVKYTETYQSILETITSPFIEAFTSFITNLPK